MIQWDWLKTLRTQLKTLPQSRTSSAKSWAFMWLAIQSFHQANRAPSIAHHGHQAKAQQESKEEHPAPATAQLQSRWARRRKQISCKIKRKDTKGTRRSQTWSIRIYNFSPASANKTTTKIKDKSNRHRNTKEPVKAIRQAEIIYKRRPWNKPNTRSFHLMRSNCFLKSSMMHC